MLKRLRKAQTGRANLLLLIFVIVFYKSPQRLQNVIWMYQLRILIHASSRRPCRLRMSLFRICSFLGCRSSRIHRTTASASLFFCMAYDLLVRTPFIRWYLQFTNVIHFLNDLLINATSFTLPKTTWP